MKLTWRILSVIALMLGSGAVTSQAIIVDLTAAGASGTINSAFFQQASPGSVGTGVLEPFLRVQGNGIEKGFNTDSATVPYQTKPGLWTHSILASDVGTVDRGGTLYRKFLLDINQKNSAALLSLDQVEIYLVSASTPGANTIDTYSGLTGAGTKIYSLDDGGNNYVKLNYALNPGSGWGDMFFYLPDNLIADNSAYLYLYTIFGENYYANDGFEEWAVRQSSPAPPVIPEPTTLVLCGLGLGLAGLIRRRPRRQF